MASHVDDILFKRYLEGDLKALRSLETGLRFVAETILTKPCFGLTDPKGIRLLVNTVTEEALEHPPRDLDSLVSSVVMGAARKGIENLRRDADRVPGSNHITPGVLVNLALVPATNTGAAATAAESHLESCELCRGQIALVREATSGTPPTADASAAPVSVVETPTPGLISPIEEPTSPVDVPSPALQEAPQPVEQAPQDSSAPVTPSSKTATIEPLAARGGVLRTRRRPVSRSTPSPQLLRSQSLKLLMVPVTFVVAFAGAWLVKRELTSTSKPAPSQFASLAVRAPPPIPPADERPTSARAAFQDLESDHCSAAANRFRTARRREPENGILWYYEGLSAICAGDGVGANTALDGAERHHSSDVQNLDWYRAQAALLNGNAPAAIRFLKQAEKTCPDYKDSAWTLREQVEELVR